MLPEANVAEFSEIDCKVGAEAVMPNDTRLNLTPAELARAFDGVPSIVSPDQLANLLGLSVKTIYGWIAQGRLDGAFRRRGKHCLIWRNRAIDIIFNGKSWSNLE